MRLNKLEIKGFKSFGEKTSIYFNEGITGIVGPNGCGKSNVVDAMRWVLGEQRTKSLRSDKMENVIFNGSKNRKSLQMAEVSLTFDNDKNLLPTEYTQVTITRRYYRTGDSEYLLNNVVCRLKDIHHLLIDTGIGSDSYAIIELKMVDEILNDNNHARRGLFEKAAGIAKFKARKKETLKKLQETDENLSRVEDLLFEIHKNLKSLERQAQQAEKYQQTKIEYKKISLDFAHKSVGRQATQLTTLNHKIQRESDQSEARKIRIQETETHVKQQKIELENIEKKLLSRQKTLQTQNAKIKEFETEQKLKTEQQRFLKEKKENLEHQLIHQKTTIESSKLELESLEKQLQSVQKILSEALYNFDEKKEDLEQQQQVSSEIKQKYYALHENLKAQKKEAETNLRIIQSTQIEYNNAEQEKDRIATETKSQQKTVQEFTHKLEQLRYQLEDQEVEHEALRVNEKKLQEAIIQSHTKIEQFQESKIKLHRSLDAHQNEYQLLKSVVDSLEGFPESVKFLKKNQSWNANIPLLSDVVSCEEKYRAALENVLGKLLNYHIVQTEKEALHGLAILDKNHKGKVGFFVLDYISNTHETPILKIENAIPMIDIIEFEEKYKTLIYNLLTPIFIVTKIPSETIFDASKNHSSELVFVSEEGKIIRKNNYLFGGSVGDFEGKKIGRKSRLKKLNDALKKQRQNISEINDKIDQTKSELEDLKSQTQKAKIQETESIIIEIKQQIVSVRSRKEQLEEIAQKQDHQQENTEKKLQKFSQILNEKSPILDQINTEIHALEIKLENLEEVLEETEHAKDLAHKTYNEHHILMLQQQNKVENLSQENHYKKEYLEKTKTQIEALENELQKVNEQLEKAQHKTDYTDETIERMSMEKVQIQEGVQEVEILFYELRRAITDDEKTISELRNQQENANYLLQNMQNESNELRIQMLSMKERLAVEFEEDLDVLLKQNAPISEATESELKQKIEVLKQRLRKFGQINLTAPETYQEIKKRYDFINIQKQDLTQAKALLLKTIEETDQTAQTNFMNSFHQIRQNFIHVFRSLFSEEDSCDLLLSDPKNPLESKLEIIARPKGKKPLTINQLSGGEKTLTATSLLFAIYLLRPAPFCIFDEVDAPLDDANIDKFNRIVKKFSSDSQFIIVTHNKRTMAQADVIYGVTMPSGDYGVSRVLPVDLRDLESV